MNRLLFLGLVILLFSRAGAQKAIINDPNVEKRNIGSFSAIKITDGIDLYLSQGEENALAVSADDKKYRDRIKTSVQNDVLVISFANDHFRFKPGNKKLVAYVSFKSINRLSASGASDVYVTGPIKGDELALRLSGASDFQGSVQLNKLTIDQSGASDATISGKASSLRVDASGASKMKGYELETTNCFAKASGASDIKITVHKELTATASGASSIFYQGSGVIKEVKSSGASSVNKRS